MSKAFVKGDGDSGDENEPVVDHVVPGGKNYMTPAGAERMRQELRKLRYEERP